jgi:DNA polymerase III delta subunit
MITILHGDNQVASRDRLSQLKTEAKLENREVVSIEGKGLDMTTLLQHLESQSLFSFPKTIFIDNLISSLRTGSKAKETVIEYLLTGKFDSDVVLWEGKSVGKNLLKLKKQKNVSVEDFKMPVVIFKFTESLSPQSIPDALFYFNEAVKTSPVEVIFSMLVRQFRILVATATNANIPETEKMIPWVKSKVAKQASNFSIEQLQKLYKDLLIIDFQTKTGRTPFDLTKSTQQFIMNL